MKFIKISLYIVLGILAIVLIAAGIFVATFDANDYKPQISEQVKQHTGRDFILGDIKPSVFPWLGIELQQLALSNAKGFSAEKMLQIERLDVRVALLPLLKQELRVDTLRVHGLQLSLAKNSKGKTNWDDILEKQKTSETPTKPLADQPGKQPDKTVGKQTESDTDAKPAVDPLAALLINGVDIKDASISWNDAMSKQVVSLQKFNLETGAIRLGKALPVKINTQVQLSEPAATFNIATNTNINFNPEAQTLKLASLALTIEGALKDMGISQLQLALDTKLDANLKSQTFVLPNYTLSINAKGEAIPGGKATAKIAGDANINLQKQLANITQLTVDTLGLSMQSQLAVTGLVDAPNIKGQFKLNEFNPSKLLKTLAIELPEMQGKKTLQTASMSFDVTGSDKSVQLKQLLIQLDQSKIKGSVELAQFDKPAIKYMLALDKIKLDNYMPPPLAAEAKSAAAGKISKNRAAPVAATKTDIPIELPIPLIRSLNIDGLFKVKTIQAFEQTLSQLSIKTVAKDGLVKVPAIKALLLGGNLVSSAQLDVRQNTPRYQMKLNAKGLKADTVVNPILQDILGEKAVRLSGATNLNMDINSKGQSVNQLMANSNGQFKLNMGKAKLHGVDAEYFVRKAVVDYAKKKKKPVPKDWLGQYKPKDTTALKMARMSATIKNGVAHNKDLLVDSSRFKVTGKGSVNLPKERLNYRVVVDVNPASRKTALERLLDIPMPVFVKGRFAQPDISIDSKVWLKSVGKELKAEVKKEVKQKIKKEKKAQKAKLKKKSDKEVEKLKDKAKDKLKGLFGR